MRSTSLCPPRVRPRTRVIFVFAPLSSTKSSSCTGSWANCSCQWALLSATASAAMRPRLQRAPLPKLLAHAAHRSHTKTENLGNFASALASLVELQNALADGDRDGRHSPTLAHNYFPGKLHHLWKCSSKAAPFSAFGILFNSRMPAVRRNLVRNGRPSKPIP